MIDGRGMAEKDSANKHISIINKYYKIKKHYCSSYSCNYPHDCGWYL